jgi:hypothetical protein
LVHEPEPDDDQLPPLGPVPPPERFTWASARDGGEQHRGGKTERVKLFHI